jgi:hypothetical protein
MTECPHTGLRLTVCDDCGYVMSFAEERLRDDFADAVTLAAMLNDEMKARDMLPHYTGIADKTLPRLRAALKASQS